MGTNPGPRELGVLEPSAFDSLGAWFTYLKAEGFNVSTQVPWAIGRARDHLASDSQTAFDWLMTNELLFVYHGGITVDLRATVMDFGSLVDKQEPFSGLPEPP